MLESVLYFVLDVRFSFNPPSHNKHLSIEIIAHMYNRKGVSALNGIENMTNKYEHATCTLKLCIDMRSFSDTLRKYFGVLFWVNLLL